MAAFNKTCSANVSQSYQPSDPDTKGKSSMCGSSQDLSDCSSVLERSQEFFQICDKEDKGFITRRDMQRLLGELPLSAEDLEKVFDSLDADGNGFLTPEEFSSGFSEFVFGPVASGRVLEMGKGHNTEQRSSAGHCQSTWGERASESEDEEENHFRMLMENLGANSIFEDAEDVRSLWAQLRRDEPHLLSNFEEFLSRVTYQIKEAHQEKKEMESALKRKAASHDDEIQRLYEEMEQQIKNEKDRILLQDSERFLTLSQDLEHQLSNKEKELELLSNKQKRLEQQCRELHSEQKETAVENVKLKRYNEDLTAELEHTTQELSLTQEQLIFLQDQASRLHEERELEMYRVTESLQRERASLLKQLDLLREMNKHLRDERDMFCQKPKNAVSSRTEKTLAQKNSERKPSFNSEFEDDTVLHYKRKGVAGVTLHGFNPGKGGEADTGVGTAPQHNLQRIISIEEDHLPHLLQTEYQSELCKWTEEDEDLGIAIDLQMSNIYPSVSTPIPKTPPASESRRNHTPTSPRGQPVGREMVQMDEGAGVGSAPDRLFKIVLVGNSSVGKTSLLRRFCDDCFFPGTSATVGVDYSVKTLTVDGSQVALQMWDTAGQERYRSITKQFFRKADGVVVMYDISSAQSFTAVRSWLVSVQEGAGEEVPVMLLGNKTDLEAQREVQFKMGERLSQESRLSFFECSASSGHNVNQSMIHLARILKEQEDREKEKTVSLIDNPPKKKSCC